MEFQSTADLSPGRFTSPVIGDPQSLVGESLNCPQTASSDSILLLGDPVAGEGPLRLSSVSVTPDEAAVDQFSLPVDVTLQVTAMNQAIPLAAVDGRVCTRDIGLPMGLNPDHQIEVIMDLMGE